MEQINEDYVSFETAKLLKEKGFDIYVSSFYDNDGKYNGKEAYWNWNIGSHYSAPTLQMAMKWLREVHNIHIELRVLKPYGTDGHHHAIPKDGVMYCAEILHIDKWDKDLEEFKHVGLSTKDTNEKACEAAIKYCLENLI